MDCRTEVEKKLHDIIREAIEAFSAGRVGRESFRDMMGHLRDAKVLLDNKEYGCPAGRHAEDCQCAAKRAA